MPINRGKAQGAIEYMMTYGWAVLIIALVAGLLYQLGFFSSTPQNLAAPGSCQVQRPNGPGTVQFLSLSGLCNEAWPQTVGSFDGATNYMMVPTNSPNWNYLTAGFTNNALTVTAWIYVSVLPSGTNFMNPVSFGSTAGSFCFAFYDQLGGSSTTTNKLAMGFQNGAAWLATNTATAGKWYFTAMTYSNTIGSVTMYLNGVGNTISTSSQGLAAQSTVANFVVGSNIDTSSGSPCGGGALLLERVHIKRPSLQHGARCKYHKADVL